MMWGKSGLKLNSELISYFNRKTKAGWEERRDTMRKIVTARWHVYNKIRSHKPEVRSYIKIYTNVPKKENKNNSTMGSNCEEPYK